MSLGPEGRVRATIAVALLALLGAAACSDDDAASPGSDPAAPPPTSTSAPVDDIDRVVDIGGGRGLYLRCTGAGTPTVIMEGGDQDTSSSYRFAEADVSAVTRMCVYDRGNLGRSGPAPGPRGLSELVGDLEALVEAAGVDGPYVMVGTSGGGYISVGFAVAQPDEVAGIVLVEVASPFVDPPPDLVELTAWDHPQNIEQRDYLQVEKDAWAARREIGDIPVTVISNDYGPDAEFPGERSNVEDQKGWLVLSPRAEQIVVDTGHAVEEEDPQLVIDAILEVVEASR